MEAFRESKRQTEALVARMESDDQIPDDLRQLSFPGIAYGLEAAQRQMDGVSDSACGRIDGCTGRECSDQVSREGRYIDDRAGHGDGGSHSKLGTANWVIDGGDVGPAR